MRFAIYAVLLIGLLMIALVLTGCGNAPVGAAATDNPSIDVELLFTHEGCNVYRFRDGLRLHYWADCRGSVSGWQTCGKNCTEEDSITTTTL